MRPALFFHSLLMLLASTSFTIVTFMTGGERLSWCYFKYAFENGFGYTYEPAFGFQVVVAYVLAFVCGIVGFALAYRRGRYLIGLTGIVLSAIGLISFAIEASHWMFEHSFSLLAFSPAVMFFLAALALVPWNRASSHPPVESHVSPQS